MKSYKLLLALLLTFLPVHPAERFSTRPLKSTLDWYQVLSAVGAIKKIPDGENDVAIALVNQVNVGTLVALSNNPQYVFNLVQSKETFDGRVVPTLDLQLRSSFQSWDGRKPLKSGPLFLEGLDSIPNPETIDRMFIVPEGDLGAIPDGIFERFSNLAWLALANVHIPALTASTVRGLQKAHLSISHSSIGEFDLEVFSGAIGSIVIDPIIDSSEYSSVLKETIITDGETVVCAERVAPKDKWQSIQAAIVKIRRQQGYPECSIL